MATTNANAKCFNCRQDYIVKIKKILPMRENEKTHWQDLD